MAPISATLWPRLQPLLLAALRLPVAQQAAFVARRCADEPVLRAQLQRLLDAANRQPASALEAGSAMRLGGESRPLSSLKPAQRLNPYRKHPRSRT